MRSMSRRCAQANRAKYVTLTREMSPCACITYTHTPRSYNRIIPVLSYITRVAKGQEAFPFLLVS